MKIKKILPAAVLAGAAAGVWLAIDLWRPVSSDLRKFDPEEVARLDTAMWRSYYDKESLKLFNQLTVLLRHQYGMPFARSYVVGFHAAKAAFVFKDGMNRVDYERALPGLVAYYQAIRKISKTPFHVDRAADLELEWWIVHRERRDHQPGDLDRALADLAAEIYQMPAAKFAEHARYRAEAMVIRDDRAEDGSLSDADWRHIHELLRRSWFSLWHAVNDTE